ncbi:MAG: thioesterase family protein [Methanocellales archaeon]
MTLEAGLTFEKSYVVTSEMLASRLVPGTPDAFATPFMVALIEHTCNDAVQPHLNEGQGTVGTVMNAKHFAPTPVGMRVTARARLEAVEGRKLVFKVEVFDEAEKIGEALHERFIIDKVKFAAKIQGKARKV